MNAFELISMNKGLNLDNFFESDKVRIFWVSAAEVCITNQLISPICVLLYTFSTKQFEMCNCADELHFTNLWQKYKRETRFTSQCPPKEIIDRIEEAAKPLGFDIQKKNYKVWWQPFTIALLIIYFSVCRIISLFQKKEINLQTLK
jgi:5'-AMP-activated protein kinase catalytic alpha subunit